MNKLIGCIAVAFVGLNLSLPAQAIRVTAQDIVCHFKYKVGDDAWVLDSTGATTRAGARRFKRQVLQRQQRLASEAGQELRVISMGCEDPFGDN